MKKLQSNIKYYREKQDWSQDTLAEKLNVSRSLIGKWETGISTPDAQSLTKLSELFGVSLDHLVGHHIHKDLVIREISKLYRAKEDDVHEELVEVVEHLLRHPELAHSLYLLTQLEPTKQKPLDEIIRTTIVNFTKALG